MLEKFCIWKIMHNFAAVSVCFDHTDTLISLITRKIYSTRFVFQESVVLIPTQEALLSTLLL